MLGEQRIKICIVNPKRKEKQGTDPTNIIGYNYNAIVLKAMVMCFVLLKKKKVPMKHREIKDRSMSTWVEKAMATHSSILAWEISWT